MNGRNKLECLFLASLAIVEHLKGLP
jgi:hypothetical protein